MTEMSNLYPKQEIIDGANTEEHIDSIGNANQVKLKESENESSSAIIQNEFEDNEAQELNEISDLSKKGYQFLKENRTMEAMACFTKILENAENNNYALVGMGDVYRKQGYFRNAVLFYKRCLTYHPGNNYALFGLADSYKALNQYRKAIEIWEKYLVYDSNNIIVLTRVADAYRKVQDYNHSKESYLHVLELESQNPYAIIGLGHLHYDFKEYREALTYWEKMLELNKEAVDIRVLTSIGNCHRKLKTFSDGIQFFEMALKRDHNNFYALFGLADCYRGLQQQDRCLEYWNRILEQDPRNKVILTRAGDAYRNMDEYDKAADYYKRALNIEYDTFAVLGLAIIAKAQGRYDEAIESMRRLIQQDPWNFRFCLVLAESLMMKGEKRQAIEVLENFQHQGIRNNAIHELLEKIKS